MYVCGSIIIISTLPLPHLPSDISHCLDCFIDLSELLLGIQLSLSKGRMGSECHFSLIEIDNSTVQENSNVPS